MSLAISLTFHRGPRTQVHRSPGELLWLPTQVTYTSTGVRPPWVTEQQTAPASANLEYNARPLSFSGVCALVFWTMASSFVDPVDEGGADAAMVIVVRGGGPKV